MNMPNIRNNHWKLFLVIIGTSLAALLIISTNNGHSRITPASHSETPRQGRDCFTTNNINYTKIELFEDVLVSQPLTENTIFFHETSCMSGLARLNVRQACAVESAARANPGAQVYLLYTSPVGFHHDLPRPAVFDALAKYPNVHVRNANLWTYAIGTPAENWLHQPDLFTSIYLASHTSDLLRLISLFRWGGTYLDLDFVVRSSLVTLLPNFAGEEFGGDLNNALLNLAATGIGHAIARRAIEEYVSGFDGQLWAHNGPVLLTRVLREMCRIHNLFDCTIFRMYPEQTFYAIHYEEWQAFFRLSLAADTLAAVNGSLAVHFWNKMSSKALVEVGGGSAYDRLAQQFCPRVYATVDGGWF